MSNDRLEAFGESYDDASIEAIIIGFYFDGVVGVGLLGSGFGASS